jgi:hypothetical protein
LLREVRQVVYVQLNMVATELPQRKVAAFGDPFFCYWYYRCVCCAQARAYVPTQISTLQFARPKFPTHSLVFPSVPERSRALPSCEALSCSTCMFGVGACRMGSPLSALCIILRETSRDYEKSKALPAHIQKPYWNTFFQEAGAFLKFQGENKDS